MPEILTKKQKVELLFDEFYHVSKSRNRRKKSQESSHIPVIMTSNFQGEDAVSDGRRGRLSGSFSKELKTIVSRDITPSSPTKDSPAPESAGSPSTLGAMALEESEPVIVSDEIHNAAVQLAEIGDELDEDTKMKLSKASERLVEALNPKTEMKYVDFAIILTNLIPLDADANSFVLATYLIGSLMCKLSFSYFPYLKRYFTEKFTQEGASLIEERKQKKDSSESKN